MGKPLSRRATPGKRVDVMRIEHENVCGQVESNTRSIRRLENELTAIRNEIRTLRAQFIRRRG